MVIGITEAYCNALPYLGGMAATSVRVTSKGQATIPKSIRRKLQIEPGGRVTYVEEGDRVYLSRVPTPAEMEGRFRRAFPEGAARGLRAERNRDLATDLRLERRLLRRSKVR